MFSYLKGVYSELIWIGLLVTLAILVSLATGYWLLSFFTVFLFYLYWHYHYAKKFTQWLEEREAPSFAEIYTPIRSVTRLPRPIGIWGAIFQLAYRQSMEQEAALRSYRQEIEKIRLATTLLPEALIALSPDGRIEWLNLAAEKMLGLKPGDHGKRIEAFLRDPLFIKYLQAQDYSDSIEFYSSINSYQLLSAQLFPYYQDHFLLLVRDVTEVNKMAQMRRDFVANASHELRTPLTVLNGYLEMMGDAEEPHLAIWNKPLEHMQSQSKRMMRIIEDLLTLSSIENKTSGKDVEQVNIVEMLGQIQQAAKELSQERHVIVFEKKTDAILMGYKQPLESVFMNLVSNAVRYTPEGGKITMKWVERNGKPQFSVSDTGIGIAREDIPRLTERFFRVDTARSRETGGTGLGLAIVKHVLDLHHAELQVRSKLYVGSTFTVVFNV